MIDVLVSYTRGASVILHGLCRPLRDGDLAPTGESMSTIAASAAPTSSADVDALNQQRDVVEVYIDGRRVTRADMVRNCAAIDAYLAARRANQSV